MHTFSKYHKDILNQKKENIRNLLKCSFEFFPPKDMLSEKKLWNSVEKLSKLKPNFFSVTYGANSGEKNKTAEYVEKINKKTGIPTAAHLTCVGATVSELKEIAKNYWNNGIKKIVALRGDAIKKDYKHKMHAVDLIILLKKIANFDISVAAYPELHPESKNSTFDMMVLKRKIDAGADRVITQFFFNIESYLRFRDNCIKNKIYIEIIPGIFPIYNFSQLKKFSNMTNVCIPNWMHETFYGLENDLVTQKIIGASIAIDMIKILSYEGVKNFHFYTLNQCDTVYSVCYILGL